MHLRGVALVVTFATVVVGTPSRTSAGEPDDGELSIAPETLSLQVTYEGFADPDKVRWVGRKAIRAFEHVFARERPATRIVGDVAPDAEVAYVVHIIIARGDEVFRVAVACRQTGNPMLHPMNDERQFAALDPLDLEEHFATIATAFAKVIAVAEVPPLQSITAGGAATVSGTSDTAPPPVAIAADPPPALFGAPSAPSSERGTEIPSPDVAGGTSGVAFTEIRLDEGAEPLPPLNRAWRIGGWVATGVGLAVLAVGAWQAAAVRSAGRDFERSRTQLDQVDARHRGERAATRSNIAFTVGGVVTAGGVGLLIADYGFDLFRYAKQ